MNYLKALDENNTRGFLMDLEFNNLDKNFMSNAKFSTGDLNTSIIIVRVLLGGKPILLKEDTYVYVAIMKNNKAVAMNECKILDHENGVIVIPLKTQSLDIAGENKFEVVIRHSDDEKLVSPKVSYMVYESFESKIEGPSENEISIFDNLVTQLKILKNEVSEAKDGIDTELAKVDEKMADVDKTIKEKIDITSEQLTHELNTYILENFERVELEIDNKANEEFSKVEKNIEEFKGVVTIELENEINHKLEEVEQEVIAHVDNKTEEIHTNIENKEFSSKEIKLERVVDEYTCGISVEGNTLQNLLPARTVTLNSSSASKAFKILDIKANTSFFVSVNITEKKAPLNGLKCGFKDKNGVWNYHTLTTEVGFQSKKFELDYDITDITFYISSDEFVSTPDANITFIEPMCYISEKEILGYFEGIRSIGEKDNKISILSSGKNLFDPNNLEQGTSPNVVGKTWNECRVDKMATRIRNVNLIKANPQTKYTISCRENFTFAIKQFDSNGVGVIDTSWLNKSTHTFTTGAKTKYLTFLVKKKDETNISPSEYVEIQLEEGEGTTYEAYKENKKDILLPFESGLKRIENIKDEINSKNNKITQKVGKIIFTGDENWVIGQNPLTNTLRFAFSNNFIKEGVGHFLNNKIKTKTKTTYEVDEENMQQSGEVFFIRVLRSKLSTQDVEGFKNLLKQWHNNGEPLTVYYELKEPKEYELSTQAELKLNKGVNHVHLNDLLDGNFKIRTSETIAGRVSNNTNAINTLERIVENIKNNKKNEEATLRLNELEECILELANIIGNL